MRSGINACMSAISYAAAIRSFNAKFLTTRRPPGCALNERRSLDRFCLTDATSKRGRLSGAWTCARSVIGLDAPIANPVTTITTDDRKRKSARFIEPAPGFSDRTIRGRGVRGRRDPVLPTLQKPAWKRGDRCLAAKQWTLLYSKKFSVYRRESRVAGRWRA